MSKYLLVVDVSTEPVDRPFIVELQDIRWNAYQQFNQRAGLLILHETKLAKIEVNAPKNARFSNFELYRSAEAHPERSRIPSANPQIDENRRTITWTIPHPETQKSYIIDWDLEQDAE